MEARGQGSGVWGLGSGPDVGLGWDGAGSTGWVGWAGWAGWMEVGGWRWRWGGRQEWRMGQRQWAGWGSGGVLVTATFAGQLAFLVPFGVVGIEVEEWRVGLGGGEYLSREESGVSGEMGERVDIVMVGGEGVGKGCLGIRFVSNHYVVEYDPTLEDGYVKCVEVDGERVGVVVKHHNVTESSYRTADGVVVDHRGAIGCLGEVW